MNALPTKELRKRFKYLGKSDQGSRQVLVKRCEACRRDAGEEEDGDETPVEGERAAPHASENHMMVMVDEATENKYMRGVLHKCLSGEGDESWLIQYMHQELKSWGHPGCWFQPAHPQK